MDKKSIDKKSGDGAASPCTASPADGARECKIDLLEKTSEESKDSQTQTRTLLISSIRGSESLEKLENMLADQDDGSQNNAVSVGVDNVVPNLVAENPKKPPAFLFAVPLFSGMINSFQAGLLGIVGKIYDPIFALWVNMALAWILWENSIHVLKINQIFFKERPLEEREMFAWWKCVVGGWFGNIGIPLTSLCIPKIGFIKFFVSFTVGQIAGSLLVDRTGFGGMVKRKLCIPQKILALFFIAIGVGLVASGHDDSGSFSTENEEDVFVTVLFCLLSIVTGLTLPTQAAVNGAASRTAAYPTFGVLCSYRSAFVTATLFMLVSRICLQLRDSNSNDAGFLRLSNPTVVEGVNDGGGHPPFYYFLYGAVGKIHIFVLMFISQKIGVTPTILLVLLGQLIASLPLDVTGGFGIGMTKRPITDLKASGVVCTAIGVMCNILVKDDTKNAITVAKI